MRFLIVRLGSLGDIVHALPAAAALGRAWPDATLDWVVDERNRAMLDLVPVVDRRLVLHTQTRPAWRDVPRLVGELRRARYDAAVDLQGLVKSAVLARASGARRVIGFSTAHLRERLARACYSEVHAPAGARHVIEKNLALVAALGAVPDGSAPAFPIDVPASSAPALVRARLGIGEADRFALLNPGAAWPNKRWPPERFASVARHLRDRHGLRSAVLWGPGEEPLAAAVADRSDEAAAVTPATSIGDLAALAREARLLVSGDTGPLHLAAAMQTPIVGIYGPTDPARNGPWSPADVSVSRFSGCECHHRRRCTARTWCVADVSAEEVIGAVDRRLEAASARRPAG